MTCDILAHKTNSRGFFKDIKSNKAYQDWEMIIQLKKLCKYMYIKTKQIITFLSTTFFMFKVDKSTRKEYVYNRVI